MKLGCIFKLIAIIIVLLGTSFYIYNKYGKDFIAERKDEAKELAIKKIEKIVNNFSADEIEEPLKEKFAKLLDDVEKKKDELSKEDFNKIVSKFSELVKENNLNDLSLDELKKTD